MSEKNEPSEGHPGETEGAHKPHPASDKPLAKLTDADDATIPLAHAAEEEHDADVEHKAPAALPTIESWLSSAPKTLPEADLADLFDEPAAEPLASHPPVVRQPGSLIDFDSLVHGGQHRISAATEAMFAQSPILPTLDEMPPVESILPPSKNPSVHRDIAEQAITVPQAPAAPARPASPEMSAAHEVLKVPPVREQDEPILVAEPAHVSQPVLMADLAPITDAIQSTDPDDGTAENPEENQTSYAETFAHAHEDVASRKGIFATGPLTRLAGFGGLLACVAGLAMVIASCAGVERVGAFALFSFSQYVLYVSLGGLALALLGGLIEHRRMREETHILAALFTNALGAIGGALLYVLWMGWKVF